MRVLIRQINSLVFPCMFAFVSLPPKLRRPQLLLHKPIRHPMSVKDNHDPEHKRSCKRHRHKFCACKRFPMPVPNLHNPVNWNLFINLYGRSCLFQSDSSAFNHRRKGVANFPIQRTWGNQVIAVRFSYKQRLSGSSAITAIIVDVSTTNSISIIPL